jgi:hypothetical protein
MITVHNVSEGREACDNLRKELSQLSYNPDLQKMLRNIDSMVTELSKLEVNSRRLKSSIHVQDQLDKINSSLNHLNSLILMARIMD